MKKGDRVSSSVDFIFTGVIDRIEDKGPFMMARNRTHYVVLDQPIRGFSGLWSDPRDLRMSE